VASGFVKKQQRLLRRGEVGSGTGFLGSCRVKTNESVL
jgi:hypothetical protein